MNTVQNPEHDSEWFYAGARGGNHFSGEYKAFITLIGQSEGVLGVVGVMRGISDSLSDYVFLHKFQSAEH